MIDGFSKQRMFDGKIAQASLLFSWQSRFWQYCEPDSKHATYPSLYEASWRADARMSISMRLSCKVSRNVCFAMFLHTGGKMDMKLVWDVRAKKHRNANTVCDHQANINNNNTNWQMEIKTDGVGQKKPRPLWNYFYRGVRQITSICLVPFIWALPYLVLYEPCPSLQASCSSLINIRVFWLL